MKALNAPLCEHCGVPTLGTPFCCIACEALSGKFKTEEVILNEFSYLDQINFKEHYRVKSRHYDYELHVGGLHCASCIHLIEKIPDYDSSVLEARVDYANSRLTLKVDSHFSLAKVSSLLSSWGYTPYFISSTEESNSALKIENKILLKNLAIAGACAGNIMLFVIPIYAGLKGDLEDIFNWVSFFLFLPILLYSGQTFYRGAWNSLRFKTINVDLSITVALIGGFILSTINLVRGNGAIYYDSTASFIFLILCARYFLKRSQQKFSSVIQIRDFVKDDHFTLMVGSEQRVVSTQEIKSGDRLLFKAGQVSPVDGVIIDGPVLVDVAVLNGEPLPRLFETGMTLLAGSKILSPTAQIRTTSDSSETHLSQLINELKNNSWKKSRLIGLTDKCAKILILSVFAIAILFFVIYFQFDSQEAFNRSLALIVLACPCALAFGAPLTLNLALKAAQEKGILIRNSEVFEKILNLKNIFFDKTGTLTEIDLKLKKMDPEFISKDLKALILSLEQKSHHPVAFALRKAWPDIEIHEIEDLREVIGKGVQGTWNNQFYEVCQNPFNFDEKTIALSLKENGKTLVQIYLEAPIHPESIESVTELKKRGYDCFLVSGDRPLHAFEIGTQCNIDPDKILSNLSPQQKRDVVEFYENTCMVGDGTNDALAVQKADIGIAVQGSTYINMKAADIYLTRSGLKPIIDLLDLSKKTKKVLIRNLTFSLVYNILGGILALAGFINPLLAAILMPISSLLIIASTLWGFR